MPLEEYEEKRDFEQSPEPPPGAAEGEGNRYVIQKHDASRLHYDLRLECDGVLLSWAVPKGPSLNPADKRLAVHVEDHPIDYADFEGAIPNGQYGGGAVMVWDAGTFENPKDTPLSEQLERGHVEVRIHGQKFDSLLRNWARPRRRQLQADQDARPQACPLRHVEAEQRPEPALPALGRGAPQMAAAQRVGAARSRLLRCASSTMHKASPASARLASNCAALPTRPDPVPQQAVQGGWALIRMRGRGEKNWLLIKMKDEYADRETVITEAEPDSALTGRSLEQIAAEEGEEGADEQ